MLGCYFSDRTAVMMLTTETDWCACCAPFQIQQRERGCDVNSQVVCIRINLTKTPLFDIYDILCNCE